MHVEDGALSPKQRNSNIIRVHDFDKYVVKIPWGAEHHIFTLGLWRGILLLYTFWVYIFCSIITRSTWANSTAFGVLIPSKTLAFCSSHIANINTVAFCFILAYFPLQFSMASHQLAPKHRVSSLQPPSGHISSTLEHSICALTLVSSVAVHQGQWASSIICQEASVQVSYSNIGATWNALP